MRLIVTILSEVAVIAPLAVGLSIIYRMSGVINFAAGTLAITAGYIAVSFSNSITGVALALLLGAVLGVLIYLTSILPGRYLGAPAVALTLATVGFSVALEAVGVRIFGGVSQAADPWIQGSLQILGTNVTYQRMVVVSGGLSVVVLVVLLFDKTMTGRSMEACAANEPLAQLYGTNPSRYHLTAWAVCGFCCAATGVLQVTVAAVSVSLSLKLLLIGIIGAVVGGIGGLRSSALGVLLVGVLSAVFARFVTTQYALAPVFALLLVALYFRPHGVFASNREAERV